MGKIVKTAVAFFCVWLCMLFCLPMFALANTDTKHTIETNTDTDTSSDNVGSSIELPPVASSELDIPTPIGESVKEHESTYEVWKAVTGWIFIIIAVLLIISVILSISNAKAQKKESFNRKSYSRQRMKYKRHKLSSRYNSKK